jgi:peptide deformylase
MPFILHPDPRLTQKADLQPSVTSELRACGTRLFAALVDSKAYGLAAAHIGEILPVIALSTAPDAGERSDIVLYNPVVTAIASETESGREASVSLPGIEVDIIRPVWADIAYKTAEGAPAAIRFKGFVARCALHEIDQMNGVFFLNHLSRLKRDMVLKKYSKLNRAG